MVHPWPASLKLGHLELEFSNYDPELWTGEFHEGIEVYQAQIAFVLKQADEGTSVAEVCRKAGISLRGPSVLRPPFMSGGRSTAICCRRRWSGSGNWKTRTRSWSRSWRNFLWTKPCCKMCLRKSFKACSETSACGSIAVGLECVSQTGLFHTSSCLIALYLQVPTERSGRSEGQDQGYLWDARALRLSSCSHPA